MASALTWAVLAAIVACVAGWGAVGHQSTAAIAENLLTAAAKAKVKSILPPGATLEYVCWMRPET